MPQSLTLSVTHLPASTSFYLAALAPLNLIYRCSTKSNNTTATSIGFGPSDLSKPPDFWLTQSIPGMDAGAVHVSFAAQSRAEVEGFFREAAQAGGKVYGIPEWRGEDYYSAAVIDMDGNSVEAVWRPNLDQRASAQDSMALVRVEDEEKQLVKSASDDNNKIALSGDGAVHDMMRSITEHVRSARPLQLPTTQLNSGPTANTGTGAAVMGTLLGVVAGAALHYAFANNKSDDNQKPSPPARSQTEPARRSSTYRDKNETELPYRHVDARTQSVYSNEQRGILMIDNDRRSENASTVRPDDHRRRSVAGRSNCPRTEVRSSTAQQSTSQSASQRTGVRMIEAPPSAYKSPISSARSSSRPRQDRRSSTNGRSDDDDRTIVRVVTEERITNIVRRPSLSRAEVSHSSKSRTAGLDYGDERPRMSRSGTGTSQNKSSQSRVTTSTKEKEAKDYPLPPSLLRSNTGTNTGTSQAKSRTTTILRRQAEDTPLPPSRASTWTANESRSVVSKVKALSRLDVPRSEVGPEDSVSQAGSSRRSGSERSRRSGR